MVNKPKKGLAAAIGSAKRRVNAVDVMNKERYGSSYSKRN